MRTAAKSPDSRASGGRESGAAGRVSRDELSVAIEGALRRMTLAAKIRLLSGADSFSLHGDSEIALDSIVLSDGP
ncbi:hypothetical protein, partial [Escherichia coli]|uniref:hypothetical protein n=1 Tax=Escherichia coli TaxID=562 RepID=UPI001F32B782